MFCPASLLITWKNEIQKFMPKIMRPILLTQSMYEYPGAIKRKIQDFFKYSAAHVVLLSHDAARNYSVRKTFF